jgi:hypothetical protein
LAAGLPRAALQAKPVDFVRMGILNPYCQSKLTLCMAVQLKRFLMSHHVMTIRPGGFALNERAAEIVHQSRVVST